MVAANIHRRLPRYNTAFIYGALLFVFVWIVALILTVSKLDHRANRTTNIHIIHDDIPTDEKQQFTTSSNINDEIAIEISGVELQIPSPKPNEDPIQVVYPTTTNTNTRWKGLVLMLHACSHSALKFFSPSQSTCPNCVGLSEELRIIRIVIEQGYFPVAVSSINRKNGCWSNRDVSRIEAVLEHELFQRYQKEQDGSTAMDVFGIGASSGGAFAAELLTRNIVQGALVMVMSLSNEVVNKLRTSPKPIYFAPMPRDKSTMTKVIKNYHDLESVKDFAVLDRTTCGSLPVTNHYLVQRVPGMTVAAADQLISTLKEANHIDSASDMLIIDPTRSDWRNVASPKNSTHWLDTFALKPGYSPLAKALHRAWAFHEYCSEAVVPAIRLFEGILEPVSFQ